MHIHALNSFLHPHRKKYKGALLGEHVAQEIDRSTMTNAYAVLVAQDHFGKCGMVAVFFN